MADPSAQPADDAPLRGLKMRQPRLQSFRLGTEAFDFPGALPGQDPVCLKQACDAMTFAIHVMERGVDAFNEGR